MEGSGGVLEALTIGAIELRASVAQLTRDDLGCDAGRSRARTPKRPRGQGTAALDAQWSIPLLGVGAISVLLLERRIAHAEQRIPGCRRHAENVQPKIA